MDLTRRQFTVLGVTSLSALPGQTQKQIDSENNDKNWNGVPYLFGTEKPDTDFFEDKDIGTFLFQYESGGREYISPPYDSWTQLPVDAPSVTTPDLTVNDQTGVGVPDSSNGVNPGFGSWKQVSTDRPGKVVVDIRAETDGSTDGSVRVLIDETGDSTADYTLSGAQASSVAGAGFYDTENIVITLVPGAQYQIENQQDPNNGNQINDIREMSL